MLQETAHVLLRSPIFPVVEFSVIISTIIVTYWGMYISGFKHLNPAVRFSVSMFLGSFGYMAGKMVVVGLFVSKTAYAF